MYMTEFFNLFDQILMLFSYQNRKKKFGFTLVDSSLFIIIVMGRWGGGMEPCLDWPCRGLCPKHFGQDCRMTVDKMNATVV